MALQNLLEKITHPEVAEKALTSVIQEAYVQSVSPRSLDDIVQAMGTSDISKSQVSRLCAEIDQKVHAFLNRPLEGDWPYVWLEATYVKVCQGGRIGSVAVTIAVDVNDDGRREVPDMAICCSEAEAFWTNFVRKLTRRGLRGVNAAQGAPRGIASQAVTSPAVV